MNTPCNLLVCTDCAMFIANGELPESDKDCQRILAGAESIPHNVWSLETKEDSVTTFSRRPCAHCGTTLAGERHWASAA